MKEIFQLLKLTLEEKKRLSFTFLCTVFVAFFTYVFVNLVQPIIDEMFRVAPGQPLKKTSLSLMY